MGQDWFLDRLGLRRGHGLRGLRNQLGWPRRRAGLRGHDHGLVVSRGLLAGPRRSAGLGLGAEVLWRLECRVVSGALGQRQLVEELQDGREAAFDGVVHHAVVALEDEAAGLHAGVGADAPAAQGRVGLAGDFQQLLDDGLVVGVDANVEAGQGWQAFDALFEELAQDVGPLAVQLDAQDFQDRHSA